MRTQYRILTCIKIYLASIDKYCQFDQLLTQTDLFQKGMSFFKNKMRADNCSAVNMALGPQNAPFQKRRAFFQKETPAASLKSSKHGLGLPILVKY